VGASGLPPATAVAPFQQLREKRYAGTARLPEGCTSHDDLQGSIGKDRLAEMGARAANGITPVIV